jgi:hypothetical protein
MSSKTKEANKFNSQLPPPYSPGGCFIATAIYGSPNQYKLEVFREFRDEMLLKHDIGKIFVFLYYKISPPIAEIIKKKQFLKPFALYLIEPVYRLIKLIYKYKNYNRCLKIP